MTGTPSHPGAGHHPRPTEPSGTVDWVAVPPYQAAPGGWAPSGTGWSPVPGTWSPVAAPAPARPAGGDRARTVLVALVGAVAGAAVAAVVVSTLFLAGARETGEAIGDRIADRLSDEMGLGWSSDPLPDPAASGPVEQTPPVAPGVLGPDPVLDAYAQQCFDGDLQSCDDLYFDSAPGSDYEEYGTSCGGRVEPGAVYVCTELD